jgi:hypothetical protein
MTGAFVTSFAGRGRHGPDGLAFGPDRDLIVISTLDDNDN